VWIHGDLSWNREWNAWDGWFAKVVPINGPVPVAEVRRIFTSYWLHFTNDLDWLDTDTHYVEMVWQGNNRYSVQQHMYKPHKVPRGAVYALAMPAGLFRAGPFERWSKHVAS
jgi:hypothetical protein